MSFQDVANYFRFKMTADVDLYTHIAFFANNVTGHHLEFIYKTPSFLAMTVGWRKLKKQPMASVDVIDLFTQQAPFRFNDDTFDSITIADGLDRVKDRAQFFAEVRRLMKKDGTFAANIVSKGGFLTRRLVKPIDLKTLEAELKAAGLSIILGQQRGNFYYFTCAAKAEVNLIANS